MPERIDMTIYWGPDYESMSFYTMYTQEIEEMIQNYYFDQALLFTFVDIEILKEWLHDVFCREPVDLIIDTIKY
jgi:hypothetical protein|tara:strand:+ start:308 stop:529 length:222 start_codon:yes stop_codon:yes gene_type:complete